MRKTVIFLLATAMLAGGIFLHQSTNQERGPHLGQRSAPGDGRTKINREGDLEVTVTFLSEDENGPPEELLFKVELSGSSHLPAYDLAELASLVNAREERISTGFVWEDQEVGEGYRAGLLRRQNKRVDGEPFWEKGIDSLTLIFRDLGGVNERKFHWAF